MKETINKIKKMSFILLLFLNLFFYAQNPFTIQYTKDSIGHKQKIIRKSILIGSTSVYTAASLSYLNFIWYKPYKSSNFHFFNDNAEWCQMDKMGHTFTTYNSAREMYRAMLCSKLI